MIYLHYNLIDFEWRWPSFRPSEFACKHCGEIYRDERSFDLIQRARDAVGRAFRINSAHRCGIHNARVGGAPSSSHKRMAFDIDLSNHDRFELLSVLKSVGFSTFGFYQTFLHCDLRQRRIWYSSQKARALWKS